MVIKNEDVEALKEEIHNLLSLLDQEVKDEMWYRKKRLCLARINHFANGWSLATDTPA